MTDGMDRQADKLFSGCVRRFRGLRYRWAASFWEWLLDMALHSHPDACNSNIVRYADTELRLAGWCDKDAFYGDLVHKAVMRSARLFSIEGHSGMSAGLVSGFTSTVCMSNPLSPLTGEPDEWIEHEDGKMQNKRMSSVFMKDGKAYWIYGRVFREPNGVTYTSRDSCVDITFPWTPTDPEIVDVPREPEETQT